MKQPAVRVQKVKIDRSLPIDLWLPESASQRVVAREEGHVSICRHFYALAGQHARDCASRLID